MISSDTYADLDKEWSAVQSAAEADTLLAVDCSVNAKICREFDVASFPTIRLHQKDGTVERYRGSRKAKEY
jgi:protein disulfide-isomerase A1